MEILDYEVDEAGKILGCTKKPPPQREQVEGVSHVVIFGSICTDEFNEFSDVDIAILGGNKTPLDSILDIELFLEKFLGKEIDVIVRIAQGYL